MSTCQIPRGNEEAARSARFVSVIVRRAEAEANAAFRILRKEIIYEIIALA